MGIGAQAGHKSSRVQILGLKSSLIDKAITIGAECTALQDLDFMIVRKRT
jgi:hypothetical protein